jgi:hypothetical protein
MTSFPAKCQDEQAIHEPELTDFPPTIAPQRKTGRRKSIFRRLC